MDIEKLFEMAQEYYKSYQRLIPEEIDTPLRPAIYAAFRSGFIAAYMKTTHGIGIDEYDSVLQSRCLSEDKNPSPAPSTPVVSEVVSPSQSQESVDTDK